MLGKEDKLVLISVEIPPINSLIYELAFDNEYIPPMYKNLENKLLLSKFNENITNKIMLTNDCKSKSDKNVRSQVLKNHDVERLIRVKIAKGVIITNTFNNTYLREYENTKLNKPKEINPFINPSTEKILKEFCSILIIELSLKINSEKDIFALKMFFPTSQIDEEIK